MSDNNIMLAANCRWLSRKGWNRYSQHGEDGLLLEIFQSLKLVCGTLVEVGANDGLFCSNTRLPLEQGWKGVLIEKDKAAFDRLDESKIPGTIAINAEVTADGDNSLDAILDRAGVKEAFDLLVIDVDGQDYHIWNGLLRHTPLVVVIEHAYGAHARPDFIPTVGGEGQAGYDAIGALGAAKGYDVVARTPTNSILVRNGLSSRMTPYVDNWKAPDWAHPAKLNLGCGEFKFDGWDNYDLKDGRPAYPLPHLNSLSVDEIRASHLLEHFDRRQVKNVLDEWFRVLKPGGRLRLSVPDFWYLTMLYQRGTPLDYGAFITGGHLDANDCHKTIWDELSLSALMSVVGFVGIRRWVTDLRDSAVLDVSLNLEGFKPKNAAT